MLLLWRTPSNFPSTSVLGRLCGCVGVGWVVVGCWFCGWLLWVDGFVVLVGIGDIGCGLVGFSLYLGFVVVGFGLHWFRWLVLIGVLWLVLVLLDSVVVGLVVGFGKGFGNLFGGLGGCFGFWVGFTALVWLFVGLVGLLLVWLGLGFFVGCCGSVGLG